MIQRYGAVIHPEEFSDTWLERMKQAGLNVLGLHPVGGVHADQSLKDMIEDEFLPEKQALYARARSMGLEIEYEMHALSYLLPRRMFERHPDWFRMNQQGERVNDFNFCVSNGQALDYIARRAQILSQIFRPTTNRYFFWLDDVAGYGCHCPQCRPLTPSDQQLIAVNAMLRGIQQVNPEAKLAYIAYVDALKTPVTVRPEPGVFLEYAPIRRDSNRPLNDAGCPQNAAEADPIAALLDFFGRKDSQVLEYWVDNSRFSNWTKPPQHMALNEAVMAQDVAFYKEMGFESLTSFACYLGDDYVALHGEPPIRRYGEILRGEKQKQ